MCSVFSMQVEMEELIGHQNKAQKYRDQLKNDTALRNCVTFDAEQSDPVPFYQSFIEKHGCTI